MSDQPEVNGLPLPTLLASMLAVGHWVNPGDTVVLSVVPFFQGPVDFLDLGSMRLASRMPLADSLTFSE